jgi:hypothetical protein
VNTNTESLLSDVRSALHRRHIWPHSPDKDRPGWSAQPTLLDGIAAVTLTWHGVTAPDHARTARSSVGSSGWLHHLERHLEHDFIVGRLYEEHPDTEPGRTLVALLVLHAGGNETHPLTIESPAP